MKVFFRLIIASVLVVSCLKLTTSSAEESYSVTQKLKENITVQGVIANNYEGYTTLEDSILEPPKPEPEMNKHLDKKSDDYLGAIEIPAIGTSDSIYKSKGEFYLNHDYNKKKFAPGEIYMDDRTGDSLSESGGLLNGHAVPNGSKFGQFKKLLDIDEQPEILIWDESLQKVITYKMLFVSLIDGENSGIVMQFKDEGQRFQYYKNLYSSSIKQWEEPVEGSTFLLLNSCAYIIQDGHYVVVAKREG